MERHRNVVNQVLDAIPQLAWHTNYEIRSTRSGENNAVNFLTARVLHSFSRRDFFIHLKKSRVQMILSVTATGGWRVCCGPKYLCIFVPLPEIGNLIKRVRPVPLLPCVSSSLLDSCRNSHRHPSGFSLPIRVLVIGPRIVYLGLLCKQHCSSHET